MRTTIDAATRRHVVSQANQARGDLLMRTLNYDLTTGARCAATALVAKRATATLTSDPITGDSGEPIKLSGTVTITGDWEYGTYDTTTKKFTPKAA